MGKRLNAEDFETAPKKIKEKALEIIELERKIDDSPMRYFRFVKSDGDTDIIDLKMALPNVIRRLRLLEIEEDVVHNVKACWSDYRRLIGKKAPMMKMLNNMQLGTSGRGKARLKSLLDIHKSDILELMGEGRTNENVVDWFRDKSLSITVNQLKMFRTKHQNQIKELWTQHLLNDKEFHVATDRGRLQALSDMEYYYKQKFDKEKLKGDVKENTVRMRQSLLEQIRKEVKGDIINHHHTGKINVEATINANKILMENMRKIPINMMIISMTAAKRGINPLVLSSALANSYYAKYNGFNGLPPESMEDDLIYPSQIVKTYDLNQMVDQNNKDQGEGRFSDAVIIKEEKKQIIERKTKSLKEILEERKRAAGFKK